MAECSGLSSRNGRGNASITAVAMGSWRMGHSSLVACGLCNCTSSVPWRMGSANVSDPSRICAVVYGGLYIFKRWLCVVCVIFFYSLHRHQREANKTCVNDGIRRVPGVHVVRSQEGGEGRIVDEEFDAWRRKHFAPGLVESKPHPNFLHVSCMVQQFRHDARHGAHNFGSAGRVSPAFRLTAFGDELLAPKLDAKQG